MPQQDWVKENRYAIITIMLKHIAGELRSQYPDLHVKAHPMAFAASRARLVIRQKELRIIFDVRQGGIYNWRQPRPQREDPNEYTASVKITIGNEVSKKKIPPAWTFSLDDPESTIKFEAWVNEVLEKWLNADSRDDGETEHPVDSDGSTEV